MKEALKLSLALGIICAVASGVLAFANLTTRDAVTRAENRERGKSLSLVLPQFDNQPLHDKAQVGAGAEAFAFYRARNAGDIVSVAGEGTSAKGFGGDLKVLLGISAQGDIGTVIVTSHKETPGLGTQVTDRKELRSIWSLFQGVGSSCGGCAAEVTRVAPCEYLDQYAGKYNTADAPFRVKQDGGTIDAVSGATVSSRAVAEAVSRVSAAFEAHKDTILADQ